MFMDFKFSKDSGGSQPEEASGEKKKQNTLLVLLLILVGGFTYIFFFTGLIKPQEAQQAVEPPAATAQIVKIPLPPRESEPAKPEGKTPEKTEAPKTASSAPVAAAVPSAKPAAAPANPTPAAAAKPAATPPPAKLKEEPAKAEENKPAGPVKMSLPAKNNVKKPAADSPVKKETAVKAKKAAPVSWSLVIGNYVLEEALSADMGRVRKAGFTPIVKPSTRKKTSMNRLFVSEFTDRASALSTLGKLKRHTSDAFVIEQGGRFAVYAGSYLQNEAASSEKERLKAVGFDATVKHADIAIPSQSLSVGPFNNKKAADAALGKLKNAGIKAALAQK
jgi:cell division septation protein DedD